MQLFNRNSYFALYFRIIMVLVLQAASSIQAYVLAFETMTEISLLALGKDNLVFGMVIFKSTTFAGLALQPPPLK